MTTKVLKSGTQTATAATDTFTFTDMNKGELKKIEIRVSASTTFKVYTLQDDGSTADEYIIGTATQSMTVAAATHLNPARSLVKFDGSAWDAASNTSFVVSRNQIKVDASNLTAADTWSVDLTIKD